MAENKQLGTLQLNSGNVLQTINKVNEALKNIGKGVNLDLTKILDAKVSQTLNGQQQQINAIGKGASNAAKQTSNEVKQATAQLKEQINLQAKLTNTNGSASRDVLTHQIQTRTQALQKYTSATLEQAQASKSVTAAQEKYNLAVAKGVDKQTAAEMKQMAKEQAEAQKQAAQISVEAAREEAKQKEEALRQQKELLRQEEQYAERIGNLAVSKAGMATIRLIKEQWSAAIEYATKYYDMLNEIRVVTGKTEKEAEKMGSNLRNLAKEMKVTSTELSQAAVTFYRQGQTDDEVNERLNWVTKYAKIASIDFQTAAELITAATNSMSEDIQGNVERVVDVFLYLGDAAATSGEEIGKAMQKASASATEFGLSFEWLGAYIATVAEQTRQAPESIGNAFNTMLARMHQIKASGFNTEDETKINDVAKALATINVQLLDSERQWRNMSDIYDDIARQWDNMDAKQRAYLATTMAGTRQQNVFYALMNDMSKGIEDGSRAWELYAGAINAAGTATEKYSTWQESMTAAQSNLQNSLEALYATLSTNVLKDWYNGLAGFVDLLAQGTSEIGGFNIILGVMIVGFGSLYLALIKAGSAATFFSGILNGLSAHPVLAAIAGTTLLVTGITAAIGAFETSTEKFEKAVARVNEAEKKISNLEKTKSTMNVLFDKLQHGISQTSEEVVEYNSMLESLANISPAAKKAVDDLKDGFINQATAAGILSEELETLIKYEKDASQIEAMKAQRNLTTPESWSTNIDTVGSNEALDYMRQYGFNDSNDSFMEAIKNLVSSWGKMKMKDQEDSWFDSDMNLTVSGKLYSIIDQATKDLNLDNMFYLGNNSDQWPMLASYIYRLLVGDDKQISDFQKELESKADEWVNLALQASDNQYGKVYDGLQTEFYNSIIVGSDGVLSKEDLSGIGNKLFEAVNKWLVEGMEMFSGEDKLKYLFKNILGEDALSEMETWISELAENEEYVSAIEDAYTQMLEAGLSDVDISEIYSRVLSEQGVEALEDISLSKILGELLGVNDFSEYFSFEDAEGNIKNLSTETMGLMYQLIKTGTSAQTLIDIFNDPETKSIIDFETKLKKQKTGLVETESAENKETKTLTERVDEAKKALDEIDTMIKDTEEGRVISYELQFKYEDQIAGLDERQVAGKLRQMKKDAEENLRNVFKDFYLDSENVFLNSSYKGFANQLEENGHEKTLRSLKQFFESEDYIKKHGQGQSDENIKRLDEYVDAYADSMKKAVTATEDLNKAVSNFDVASKLVNQVNEAREAIKTLTEGTETDVDKIKKASDTLKTFLKSNFSGFEDVSDIQITDLLKTGNMYNYIAAVEQRAKSASKALGVVGEALIAAMHPKETSKKTVSKEEDPMETVENALKELDKLNEVYKKVQNHEPITQADLIGIGHTELASLTDDTDALKTKILELKTAVSVDAKTGLTNFFMGNEDVYKESEYYSSAFKNYREAIEKAQKEGNAALAEEMKAEISQYVQDFMDLATGELSAFQLLLERIADYYSATEALKTLQTSENAEEKRSAAAKLVDLFGQEAESIDVVKEKIFELLTEILELGKTTGDAGAIIVESLLQTNEGADTAIASLAKFAEEAAKFLEQAKASAENYQAQITGLHTGLNANGASGAFDEWNSFSKELQEAIKNRFPALITYLNKAKEAEDKFGKGSTEAKQALKTLAKELNNITGNNGVKYFNNTAKAIDEMTNKGMTAADAYDMMRKEAETFIRAQVEFNQANKDMAEGTEITTSQISNLASILGQDAQWLLDNWSLVGPLLQDVAAEGENAFQRLNEAAFIRITGETDVDFSQLINGLIDVESLGQAAAEQLAATGQWKIETFTTEQEAWIKEGEKWIKKILPAMQQLLVPTGDNPFKQKTTYKPRSYSTSGSGANRSGSSGGSGNNGNSSSSSSNQASEVEIILDKMEQIQKLYENQRSLFEAQKNYYQETGELQGVILYLQKEGEAILGQNKVLEENIAEIENWMAIKRSELNSLSQGSEEYEQAASDLKALQERHQQYTQELINNRTEIERLNKAIKEQNDKIRSMEIDLRNMILEAIKDREALNERMLEGTISTENTIMELIKKRYEQERDLILENAKKQIEALREERDLMSEQLQLRKEQQEQEDKAAKLADLQAKYARIVADPTRRNEALTIQQQIRDLQEEMAWDTAERELKIKQDELDNQISSLEDYVEYVENWYNELFEHPKQLIDEMKAIIGQADEDILNWLQRNSEEFQNATEATQQSMINSWENMLMDMHGEIKTYWDEVEEIIAGGDDAIIQFLMENSANFREAGKLQAEQYVSEWVDKLNKLALAHKQVSETMIYNNYAVIASATGGTVSRSSGYSGSGGSSYSGSLGGSSSSANTTSSTNLSSKNSATTALKPKSYSMSFMGKTGTGTTKGAAYDDLISKAGASAEAYGYDYFAARAIAHYINGGEADFTGPAWLDGTKERPERILNPKQTELFNTMVASLETIARVRVPSMPVFGSDWTGGGAPVNVGDIILNVDKLESDDDYSAVADKVIEMIMEKVNRGSAIGGIRF